MPFLKYFIKINEKKLTVDLSLFYFIHKINNKK